MNRPGPLRGSMTQLATLATLDSRPESLFEPRQQCIYSSLPHVGPVIIFLQLKQVIGKAAPGTPSRTQKHKSQFFLSALASQFFSSQL